MGSVSIELGWIWSPQTRTLAVSRSVAIKVESEYYEFVSLIPGCTNVGVPPYKEALWRKGFLKTRLTRLQPAKAKPAKDKETAMAVPGPGRAQERPRLLGPGKCWVWSLRRPGHRLGGNLPACLCCPSRRG